MSVDVAVAILAGPKRTQSIHIDVCSTDTGVHGHLTHQVAQLLLKIGNMETTTGVKQLHTTANYASKNTRWWRLSWGGGGIAVPQA